MKEKLGRRSFLKAAGLSAAGIILASCAPAAATQAPASEVKPTNAPAATTEKKKITFTMFGHPGLIEVMVPKFNETHPNVEVTFERSEGQGYDEKLAAAIAGGSVWDCFRTSAVNAARFGVKNVIIDQKPLEDADKIYPPSGFVDGALEQYDIAGKYYGHPAWASNFWIYFNKKLFDAESIPYPTPTWTWDDFVQMAVKLTKTDSSGNITQYGAAGFGGWDVPIAQHAWTAGGHFYYNDDLTAFKLDDAATIQALQDEVDLMLKYKVHPSPLNPPSSPATIMSGKVAMELNGDWYIKDQLDAWKPEFDAVQFPLYNGKRVNAYSCDPFVISSTSKNIDAAYSWISWFSSDPAAIAVQGIIVFPVFKTAYTDPAIMKTWLTAPRTPTMIQEALDHTKTLKWWRAEPHAPEFENTYMFPALDKMFRGTATAADLCKELTTQGNALIAKPIE
jgi:multiple sugar transport system substrate-binding protein